jgi:hypothetical protein
MSRRTCKLFFNVWTFRNVIGAIFIMCASTRQNTTSLIGIYYIFEFMALFPLQKKSINDVKTCIACAYRLVMLSRVLLGLSRVDYIKGNYPN